MMIQRINVVLISSRRKSSYQLNRSFLVLSSGCFSSNIEYVDQKFEYVFHLIDLIHRFASSEKKNKKKQRFEYLTLTYARMHEEYNFH